MKLFNRKKYTRQDLVDAFATAKERKQKLESESQAARSEAIVNGATVEAAAEKTAVIDAEVKALGEAMEFAKKELVSFIEKELSQEAEKAKGDLEAKQKELASMLERTNESFGAFLDNLQACGLQKVFEAVSSAFEEEIKRHRNFKEVFTNSGRKYLFTEANLQKEIKGLRKSAGRAEDYARSPWSIRKKAEVEASILIGETRTFADVTMIAGMDGNANAVYRREAPNNG